MTQAFVSDIFGLEIALGTIRKMRQRVSDAVAGVVDEAKQHVQDSNMVHADETSYQQGNADGKNSKKMAGNCWINYIRTN